MEPAPVTVIVPTFRDGAALSRALASIAGQTLQPAEVLVIDDAGCDPMLSLITGSASFARLRVLRLPRNLGPGGARNAGIAASNQPFVAFLDADDEWHPEKLARQMKIMLGSEAPALSAHAKSFESEPWPELPRIFQPAPIQRRALLLSNLASISTVVMRRAAIRHAFPKWSAGEDYFFVAANILSGIDAIRSPETLARASKAAFGDGGLSGRLFVMLLGEMRAHFHLWRVGLIVFSEYLILVPWALLKFLRRLVIVVARRLRLFWLP